MARGRYLRSSGADAEVTMTTQAPTIKVGERNTYEQADREDRFGRAANRTVLLGGPERKPRVRLWNGWMATGWQRRGRHHGAVSPDVQKRPANPACRRQRPGSPCHHNDVSRPCL